MVTAANGSRIALWSATLTRGTNQQETNLATLKIDGEDRGCEAPDDTPLLWVIREELKLTGTKFGYGRGLCGACVVHIDGKRAGQIMSAADLLKRNPHPTRPEILAQMSGHICRCGTYPRILRAIERASREN